MSISIFWYNLTANSEAPAYATSLVPGSMDTPPAETYMLPTSSVQPSSSKENVLGGFMTMNGTQIKYSPRSSQRNVRKGMLLL